MDEIAAPAQPSAGDPQRTDSPRLEVVELEVYSVARTAFALAVMGAAGLVVVVVVARWILDVSGLWSAIDAAVASAIGPSAKEFHSSDVIDGPTLVLFFVVTAIVEVPLLTALAIVAATTYNRIAAVNRGVRCALHRVEDTP
jgi:hypothetical protein